MYSSKDAANTAYPTQWALNPTAYQNVDCSHVDWAALAQQWIAMKEAAAIVAAPPPPSKDEEGEAPMEVENLDSNNDAQIPVGAEWNAATNSWGGNWNQWGWGWPGAGPVDHKMAGDPNMAMGPMMDGFPTAPDGNSQMPGYSTGAGPAPTFQHGYWTAPQAQNSSRSSSSSRDRRAKSKNRDHKSTRTARPHRDKMPVVAPVIEPLVVPTATPTPTIDAAKRRQLPAWIREGLEKMEREKQRAIEREEENKAREEAEKIKKKFEEEELERMKAEAGGGPVMPAKSKFESDSEPEDAEKEDRSEPNSVKSEVPEFREKISLKMESVDEPPPLIKKSKEEIMQEVMLAVRRSLTEILLEVTDQEIQTVSQEEMARYTAVQASRLNAMKASKSKALAAIASGLGLGAYESSSDESADENEQNDITDQQLQDMIRRKKQDFERTSREIEAEVRRAEAREADDQATPVTTPERPLRSRSSATPPPLDGETPEKLPERRPSRDKRNNRKSVDRVDGPRKLESIPEEKSRKSSKRQRTPSPHTKSNHKSNDKNSSPSSSDSEGDSSSNSNESSQESETETKLESNRTSKRKRSSSGDSRRKHKKEKPKKDKSRRSYDRHSRSKHDDYERSDKKSKRKDDYKSKSRDYKYREDSEERSRKRSKRSRSVSYESRSGRRRSSRRSDDRDRSYDKRSHGRDRSYDKYDRYERSRDYDRRRSRSASRARQRR